MMAGVCRRFGVGVFAVVLVLSVGLSVGVAPSFALRPWWHLGSGARPSYLPVGGKGEIVVNAENFGDADADGSVSPVQIVDHLPSGLKALGISAGELNGNNFTPFSCVPATLTCSFEGKVAPYVELEVRIEVEVLPGAHSGESNRVSVVGGGAPGVSLERPIVVGEGQTPFGLQEYDLTAEEEGGALDTLAGSHPFQVTGTFVFNQGPDTDSLSIKPEVQPAAALVKDINDKLPPGLVGNPIPLPRCTLAHFLKDLGARENECSSDAVVGVASVTLGIPGFGVTTLLEPIFNLEPYYGEPARFGFLVAIADVPVVLDTSVRTGENYLITVGSSNISEIAGLLSVRTTFWGDPQDTKHDSSRGWGCLIESKGGGEKAPHPCTPTEPRRTPSFLTMPTACNGMLQSGGEIDSWAEPNNIQDVAATNTLQSLDGCNRVAFLPTIQASPTTSSASAPSGLDLNIFFKDEGLTAAEGVAQSELNKTEVLLPEGLTINPSAGVGLAGCRVADYARETLDSAPGAGCPNESKLGTVSIETPLLNVPINGNVYIAQPYENQFGSLVALYIVAKNPETGLLIKLAGKVTPNLVTGQLTTVFENNPQLPFGHFNFHFREGQQAPLITPALCGAYTTQATLTPWSDPLTPLTDSSSFTLTKGYDGGACPSGGAPPFKPGITSGTLNNNAASFSPFYLHLSRNDGEQEISGFSTNLPAGLTGDLTGIPFCPNTDIEAARHETGAQEEAQPSCPAASRVGHTLVGTGVGAVLAYVPGQIYLAGPFHGAPLSIVSITSAVVGPFDLGTVVLRFGLDIDPITARVNVTPTSAEPIPTIIDGIVTHVRDIRVYIDRPNFILNPTSCDPLSISSTLDAPSSANSTITSPYQASNCQALKFAPKFSVSTSGQTSRTAGASLHVNLTYPAGALGNDANIAKVKVDLPRQLPSRLSTLQKACTDEQFEANPAGCPAESRVGQAKAITPLIPEPLEGPAYFVSHGGAKFPELIMVLQGYGFTIDLHGETFISEAGITSSTFAAVPDQPIGSFELTLPEGKYSALGANANLCEAGKTVTVSKRVRKRVGGKTKLVTVKASKKVAALAMPTLFVAQNGTEIKESTPIAVTGCAKATKSGAKPGHGAKKKKKKKG